MSEIKNIIVDTICPHCQQTEKSKIWISFNNWDNPKVTKRVVDDTFFNKTCSSCGKLYYLDFTTIYKDEDYGIVICYAASEEEFVDAIVTFNNEELSEEQRKLANTNTRIVRDRNSFREKIRIFSMDMDDRTIEVLKVHAIESIREKGYNEEIKQVLCWVADDRELNFSFFDENYDAFSETLTLSYDAYKEMYNTLHPIFTELDHPEYVIDLDWAINFMDEHDL